MTTLRIDRAVLDGYPEVGVAVVVARGLAGGGHWAEPERLLAGLEDEVARGTWTPPDETDPAIAAWHAVYRRFGTNPRRARPSVDALCRRLRRTGKLPRINGAVDTYNAVSVRYRLAAGAFDLGAVHGDIVVRPAVTGDKFTPLGEPGAVEEPRAGEVVYADASSVLTRHWNHRDADRTKVTAGTRDAVFLLESALGPDGLPLLDEGAKALMTLLTPRAGQISQARLGPAQPDPVSL